MMRQAPGLPTSARMPSTVAESRSASVKMTAAEARDRPGGCRRFGVICSLLVTMLAAAGYYGRDFVMSRLQNPESDDSLSSLTSVRTTVGLTGLTCSEFGVNEELIFKRAFAMTVGVDDVVAINGLQPAQG